MKLNAFHLYHHTKTLDLIYLRRGRSHHLCLLARFLQEMFNMVNSCRMKSSYLMYLIAKRIKKNLFEHTFYTRLSIHGTYILPSKW
jgi:hypothetical protein